MDLRFLSRPIMVGHYEQDPIAGPEALIDRELLGGDLSKRYNLGQYAGARGSAPPPSPKSRDHRFVGTRAVGARGGRAPAGARSR